MSSGGEQLWKAAESGDHGAVTALLRDPATPRNTLAGNFTATPIFMAARNGHARVVELLMADQRVEIRLPDVRGRSPISVAREKGQVQVLALLQTHVRKSLKISVENDLTFIRDNLQSNSPRFVQALTLLRDLFEEPETRQVTLDAHLLLPLFQSLHAIPAQSLLAATWVFTVLVKIDSVRREILHQQGLVYLIKAFCASPKSNEEVTVPLRLLLSLGKDIKESVALSVPEFPERLISLARETSSKWVVYEISGLLVLLLGHFPGNREAIDLVRRNIISAVSESQEQAFDSLLRSAVFDINRPLLLNLGVKELVQPFIDKAFSSFTLISCLIQALLSASDVSTTDETGGIPTNPTAINRVLEALHSMASTKLAYIEACPGYMAECSVVLVAIRSLATNEANLKNLKEGKVVAKLVALIKNRKQDLFEENQENLEEVANLVWTLSFDKDCRQELVAGGVADILKSFKVAGKVKQVREAVAGALWNLEKRDAAAPSPKPSQAGQGTTGPIMISYCWAQKDRMRQLAFHLKNLGFPIWLDIEQMEGSVLERMSEAIEQASVVIIGLSSNYKESQACRTEAEYSYRLKKDVLYVQAEDGYLAKGWLGAMLGNNLWYNPWSSPGGFEVAADDIVKKVKKSVSSAEPKAPGPASPASAAPAPAPAPVPATPSPAAPAAPAQLRTTTGGPRSYDGVKVPDSKEPIPAEQLALDVVAIWGVEEVCRWLRMNRLDKLLPAFVFHGITGKSLVAWRSLLSQAAFEAAWSGLGIEEVGAYLEFRTALAGLKGPDSWTTDKVVSWLLKAGLTEWAQKAREQSWTGKTLRSLSHLSAGPAFEVFCANLGIKDPVLQLALLGQLLEIF